MQIFLKASEISPDAGPVFFITANIGTVNPSSATKEQLLSGVIVDVDEIAGTVIIHSTGNCSESYSVSINKNLSDCFGSPNPPLAPTLTPTQTTTPRPTATTTPEQTPTPIQQEECPTCELIEFGGTPPPQPPPPPPPPQAQGDVHFSWNANGSTDRAFAESDAFADDNTMLFGNHWAVDWIQLGPEVPESGWNGSNYILEGSNTTLDINGTGQWGDNFYLLGRIVAATISRRVVSTLFPNTLENSNVISIGSPVFSATFTSSNFGTINSSFNLEAAFGFVSFGGIMFDFLNTYARAVVETGAPSSGPIGENVTFSTNPLLRIEGLGDSATPLQILTALSNKIISSQNISVTPTPGVTPDMAITPTPLPTSGLFDFLSSTLSSQCAACNLFMTIAEPVSIPTGLIIDRTRDLTRITPENCECGQPVQGLVKNLNMGIDNEVCPVECCCSSPEEYWWDTVGICPEAKCMKASYVKNNVLNSDIPFFFFAEESLNNPKTNKQLIVANGKLLEVNLLEHRSKKDASGVKAFYVNGSFSDKVGFYTGGSTFDDF